MKTVYKANDGTEFTDKKKCINYESIVKEKKTFYNVFKNKVEDLDKFIEKNFKSSYRFVDDISDFFYHADDLENYKEYCKLLREFIDIYENYMNVKNKKVGK